MQARPLAAAFAALVAFATPSHAAPLISPESTDPAFADSCREYLKVAAHKRADILRAQACRSFVAGYVQGWMNRQNTPVDAMPEKACLAEKDLDRFIREYVKAERGGGMPMPPNLALMGNLSQNFRCK